MIYAVPNRNGPRSYFCPDQATIDAGKKMGYEGNFFIGNENDAKPIQATNQQTHLLEVEHLFSVNKDINPDPIHVTWVVCNLNSETDADGNYAVFNVLNGYYTSVSGLQNAKDLWAQTKQDFLDYAIPIISTETWPVLPAQPISQGTQTL